MGTTGTGHGTVYGKIKGWYNNVDHTIDMKAESWYLQIKTTENRTNVTSVTKRCKFSPILMWNTCVQGCLLFKDTGTR